MRILKKEGKGYKDFYDFLGGVLGEDELVVYDRRDAFPIDTTKEWIGNTNIETWFTKHIIYGDKKRGLIKRWRSNKVLEYENQKNETKDMSFSQKARAKKSWDEIKEGMVFHFVLEVGYYHYYFEVERYIDDDDDTKVHLNYGLVEKKRIEKGERLSDVPVCLCPCSFSRHFYKGSSFEISDDDRNMIIENPILCSTYIPKFIEPNEMWNNIYEYISSLNDKEIVDTRTNEQHIDSHGFDRKISFRHRKKN